MFPIQNYDDLEGDDAGIKMDERDRPSRRGTTRGQPDEGDHDFGSSAADFFKRKPSAQLTDTLPRTDEGDRDFGSTSSMFFRHKAKGEQDEAHRMCGMVTNLLKSRERTEESADDVCRSLSGADKTACNFFVRAFGGDILQKLEEPVDKICNELDFAKTSPSHLQDQSDATKLDNLRAAEEARRLRGGDPTRDRAPTADLDEGARVLAASRARTPWGGSAGLDKGGKAVPTVSSAVQKEVGWDTVRPHEEGHPAAGSIVGPNK